MSDLTKMNQDEWLEADGLGGFASGTVSGIRTRRYHALLLTATHPPAGRIVLVNGFDASVETTSGTYALTSQLYPADVLHPDGARRITEFKADPWPQWIYTLDDGTKIQQDLFALHGAAIVCLSWRLVEPEGKAILSLRPFFSGRDYHSMHHENPAFQFQPEMHDQRIIWRPYAGIPAIIALHNGKYRHQPDWYRNFVYEQERARGLDFTEDLAAPGNFCWDLSAGEAAWILAADGYENHELSEAPTAARLLVDFRAAERLRRSKFPALLDRAADAYLVKRGKGKTIVAGYPWFTDWGRDSFISLRGLCLATERLDEARAILLEWSGIVSEGMLPNRFPDLGDQPAYNSVDASLWYIITVHDFLEIMKANGRIIPESQKKALQGAVQAILAGYSRGTRYGIRMDSDGLLAAGAPGVQLTWMDAKVGDRVVTPRIGKSVEIQALWLNALWIGSRFSVDWKEPLTRGAESFRARFWNERDGYLYDVVDADHQAGKVDPSFRPNQIFAIGGLLVSLIEGDRAQRVVHEVERRLWTPMGLRSLAPEAPGYAPRYEGGVSDRDGVYHQGTVWPWLIGAFVEAWVRLCGDTPQTKLQARKRFLAPMMRHLNAAGLGHISEIADAAPPHTPRGCPFQAWSLGEVLRLDRVVLADSTMAQTAHRTAANQRLNENPKSLLGPDDVIRCGDEKTMKKRP
jgi:predicted glycogen debranching enzyme